MPAQQSKVPSAALIKCTTQMDVFSYARIEKSLTLDAAIKSSNLSSLSDQIGEVNVMKAITGALIMTSQFFNTTQPMSESQAIQTASLLLEYYTDSLEDIILCLKKGKQGLYGKLYNRFDGEVVLDWFRQYLAEKADRRAELMHNDKYDKTNVAIDNGLNKEIASRIKEIAAHASFEMTQKYKRTKPLPTREDHYDTFKSDVNTCSDIEKLESLKEIYESHNKKGLTVSSTGQFDDYIAVINKRINHLKPQTTSSTN
jgi:hypothetical protein